MRTSSTSSMMPWPKKWAQTMFARLVAKYGFSGEASQLASTSRRSLPVTSGVGAAEELRRHHAAADRVRHLAAAAR